MSVQRILLSFVTDTTQSTDDGHPQLDDRLGVLPGVSNFALGISARSDATHYELLFEMAPGHYWGDVEHAVLDALIDYFDRSELEVCGLIHTPSVCITPSTDYDRVRAFDLDLPLASTTYFGHPEQFAALDPAAQHLVRQLRQAADIADVRLEVIDPDTELPYRLLVKRHGARSWQHVNQVVLAALAAHYHCFSRQLERQTTILSATELTFPRYP